MHPKVQIDYSRITLVSKDLKERATFDLFLKFHNNGKVSSYDKIVIAEIKQNSIDHSSPVIKQLKSMHIIEAASLSKYCLGVYHLYNDVKKNNFKLRASVLSKSKGNEYSFDLGYKFVENFMDSDLQGFTYDNAFFKNDI